MVFEVLKAYSNDTMLKVKLEIDSEKAVNYSAAYKLNTDNIDENELEK